MLEVLKTQHIGICFGPSNSANRNGVNHNRPSFTGVRYCKGEAAQVLGIALAIKMIAYIGVAPIASAFAERLPRKSIGWARCYSSINSIVSTVCDTNLANLYSHFYFAICFCCIYTNISGNDSRCFT